MLGNLIPFFFSGNSLQEYIAYYNRVLGDGGTLVDPVGTQSILKMLKDNARLDNVKLLWYGGAGVKTRVSGVNTYVSKAYSIQLSANDLAQTTELSQPWQSGNIAPNEKPCLLNPSGGSRFLSHPAISFGATEAWSVSVLLNSNGVQTGSASDISGKVSAGRIGFLQTNNRIYFQNDSTASPSEIISSISLHGKNKLLHYVAPGNGTVLVYVDGNYLGVLTVASNIIFERLLFGRAFYFYGKIHYYAIQSGALTASQVTAEYNTLRALIPEVESVTIGSQAWTTSNLDIVCDAQGVVIPEVTDNAAWTALTTPAWCHYNNDPANGAIYGKLYNWYAVKQIDDALAATGSEWRVPTQAQLTALAIALGGASVAGGKMKVAGTSYWNAPNTGANNSSGLSVLPASFRNGVNGTSSGIGNYGFFTSISEFSANNYIMYFYYNQNKVDITSDKKEAGFSIRLVKNL